jgi:ketosteroid isomerase-like protein
MPEENVEVVRRVFARLDELVGSVGPEEIEARLSDAVLEELYDPDVEWVPVPQGLLAGRSYVGYQGLRRFWADFVSTWDEYVAEPREFLDVANDQVVVIMGLGHGCTNSRSTRSGPLSGCCGTGGSSAARLSRAKAAPSKPSGLRSRRCRRRTSRR